MYLLRFSSFWGLRTLHIYTKYFPKNKMSKKSINIIFYLSEKQKDKKVRCPVFFSVNYWKLLF
jgi:hypothetical protein